MVNELKDLLLANHLEEVSDISRIVGSGNGIRRNPLVCHLIEEMFQYRLHKSELKEAACGAAFYGADGLKGR